MSVAITLKKCFRKKSTCELHSSLRHIMRLCRWAGFFPLEGLDKQHSGRIRFNLSSLYCIYYVMAILLMACEVCLTFYGVIHETNIIRQMRFYIFYSVSLVIVALLYRLAKAWPSLIAAATDIEHELADVTTYDCSRVKSIVVTYIFIVLGLVEHIFSLIFNMKVIATCLAFTQIDVDSSESFFRSYFSHVFNLIPYNFWMGVLTELANIQATFIWNFIDVMGMCFGIYLTSYFEGLGRVINSTGPKDWFKLRARYSRAVVLLNLINEQLRPFIFLNSFANLFFICLQLFKCLHRSRLGQHLCQNVDNHLDNVVIAPEYISYYFFSFLYLVARALAFFFWAANIHSAANNMMLTLYEVPTSEYNQEVQCFQMQLRFTNVALDGIFFYIDRKIILSVVGIIITYELVLLQFSFQEDNGRIHRNYTEIVF